MATATRTAAPRWEVVKIWEWEGKDGEPHVKIEPGDGYCYEDMGAANSAALFFNDLRSVHQKNAGLFFEAHCIDDGKHGDPTYADRQLDSANDAEYARQSDGFSVTSQEWMR